MAVLKLRIYWHGGVDEMQNKAIAQPAWLQLAVGALLSLAKKNKLGLSWAKLSTA